MEIKSEQKFELVNVTDIDIMFPTGLETYTVKAEDVLTLDDFGEPLSITFATGGTIKFNIYHAFYTAVRTRQVRVLIPVEPK